jgi:hypothetical protein
MTSIQNLLAEITAKIVFRLNKSPAPRRTLFMWLFFEILDDRNCFGGHSQIFPPEAFGSPVTMLT